MICGENAQEGSDMSAASMVEFMKASCGLDAAVNGSALAMCGECFKSIQKMKEAQSVQRSLVEKYELRYSKWQQKVVE